MAHTDLRSTKQDETWEKMLAFKSVENIEMKIIFEDDGSNFETETTEKQKVTKHELTKRSKKNKLNKNGERGFKQPRSNKRKKKKHHETFQDKDNTFGSDEIVSIHWNNLEELSSASDADEKTKEKNINLPIHDSNVEATKDNEVLPKNNLPRSLPVIDDIHMQNEVTQIEVTQNNEPLKELQEFVGDVVTRHMYATNIQSNDETNQLTTVTSVNPSETSDPIVRTFPRVKYTSRRDVKKYPGKMHAMKNYLSQKSVPSESITEQSINNQNSKIVEADTLNTMNEPKLPPNRVDHRYENSQSYFLKCTEIISEKLLKLFPYLNEFLIARDSLPLCEHVLLAKKNALTQMKNRTFWNVSYTLIPIYSAFESESFTKNFFDKTLKLAAHQAMVTNVHGFQAENFSLLFGEMLKYIEKRIEKEQQNITFAKSVTPTNINQVTQESSLPWQKLHGHLGNVSASENSHFQFSVGPPGREIRISFGNNEDSAQGQTCLLPGNHNVRLPAQSAHPVLTSVLNEPSRLPTVLRTAPPMHSYHRQVPPPPPYQQTYTHTSVQPPSHWHNTDPPPPPPPPPSLLQPPPYRQEVQNYQNRDAVPSIMMPAQERSSVSRDSGFFSPLCEELLSNFEQMESPGPVSAGEDASSLNTLQITHVTSMNPKATFTPYSQCRICGTITNLRCLGCNRDYYCSNMCQNADWNDHKKTCHQST
ncbi:unnamed protein product [Plutella xylostella]|uniref:(diamondback moth) hypothetical protein n=1 Tax=Plutella xylostella TaxID=51655 RepID=A0A8S4DMS3_PLUXY|nr:unnamed protein product [Plutella xylostella]